MTVEYYEIRPPTEEEEELAAQEEEQLEHQRILEEWAKEEREQLEGEQEQLWLEGDNDRGNNFDSLKEAEAAEDFVEYFEEYEERVERDVFAWK